MGSSLQALSKFLVIRPDVAEEVRPSGIILPPQAQKNATPLTGVVVSIGPDVTGNTTTLEQAKRVVEMITNSPGTAVTPESDNAYNTGQEINETLTALETMGTLRVGDRVCFAKYGGQNYVIGGIDYCCISMDEVFARVIETPDTEPVDITDGD